MSAGQPEPEGEPSDAAAQPWGRLTRPRVPLVLQTEAAECGLACLAMVAGAHGYHTDLGSLRARFQVSLKGMTLEQMMRIADALHLSTRAVRAEPHHLAQLPMPCVLHWDLNHFVVLVSCRGQSALVYDPARGARRMSLAELGRHFTGVALELRPGVDFRPAEHRQRIRLRQVLGPVPGLRGAMAQIVLLALLLEALVLLGPFLLQWVVDEVISSADRDLLFTLGVGTLLLVALQAATAAARTWAVVVLSVHLSVRWFAEVFGHLMRLPLLWFERRHVGDIWSRFGSVQQIQRTLTTHFIEALIDGCLVLVSWAVMAAYSLSMALLSASALGLYALLRLLLQRRLRQATQEVLVQESRKATHFLESLRGVQAIKLFNAQADRRSRFANLVVDAERAGAATRGLQAAVSVGQRFLVGAARVGVVWLGALLVLEQRLSVGMLFAYLAFNEQFVVRMAAFIDRLAEVAMLRVEGERLGDIVLAAPEADASAPRAGVPRQAPGAPVLAFKGVHFRYADGEAEVLAGVDWEVRAGECVAVVGPSGGGKSTLLKLVLGIHAPTAGEVLVHGRPLREYGVAAWRDEVGVVMQDEPLFSASVEDNICFFASQPDREWMRECARLAAVDADIEAMPMGYRTLVADMGSSLSGGQRQRILLARALYKRPCLLLLDEATSSLDVAHEAVVNAHVRGLAVTRIIVAHRPETIASADRVVRLEGGRLGPGAAGQS